MIIYLILLLIILLVGAPRVIMVHQAGVFTYSVEDVSAARVAVVFGAG